MPDKSTSVSVPLSLLTRIREIQTRRFQETQVKPTIAQIISDALDACENRVDPFAAIDSR